MWQHAGVLRFVSFGLVTRAGNLDSRELRACYMVMLAKLLMFLVTNVFSIHWSGHLSYISLEMECVLLITEKNVETNINDELPSSFVDRLLEVLPYHFWVSSPSLTSPTLVGLPSHDASSSCPVNGCACQRLSGAYGFGCYRLFGPGSMYRELLDTRPVHDSTSVRWNVLPLFDWERGQHHDVAFARRSMGGCGCRLT